MKRVLIVSITARGSANATGQLIDTLFGFVEGVETLSLHAGHANDSDEHAQIRFSMRTVWSVWKCIYAFRPEIVYVRPTLKPFALSVFTWVLIVTRSPKVIVHIMDDEANDRTHGGTCKRYLFSKYLGWLLRSAAQVFTISPGMSQVFRERYRIESQPLSNFTEPETYGALRLPKDVRNLKVGYFGSMDARMNLACIEKVCHALESIDRDSFDVSFDIYTRPMYKQSTEANFDFLKTRVFEYVPAEEYERTLQSYDVLLIGYNFDNISIEYCRYSIANKLADYINACIPILVVGPDEVETVSLCKKYGIGTTLSNGYVSLNEDVLAYLEWLCSGDFPLDNYVVRHRDALQLEQAFNSWTSVFCETS